jgi:hypothetical protein
VESVAKRTALQATPQKMKQQQRTKIGHNELDHEPSLNVGLNKPQRKYKTSFRGLMAPSGPGALEHPAAPLLLELATLGCSTETGDSWCMELLEAAIKKGAHPFALVPEAMTQLRKETLEKVHPTGVVGRHTRQSSQEPQRVTNCSNPPQEPPIPNDTRPVTAWGTASRDSTPFGQCGYKQDSCTSQGKTGASRKRPPMLNLCRCQCTRQTWPNPVFQT